MNLKTGFNTLTVQITNNKLRFKEYLSSKKVQFKDKPPQNDLTMLMWNYHPAFLLQDMIDHF